MLMPTDVVPAIPAGAGQSTSQAAFSAHALCFADVLAAGTVNR